MKQLVRCLPCLLSLLSGPSACGGDDAASDAGPDAPNDADQGDAATDVGVEEGRTDDAAEPEDGFSAEHAPDADDPDGTSGGDAEETGLDSTPGDAVDGDEAGGELCSPASVGWDTPLGLPPADFQAMLAAEDRILINVFDGDIPQIPGTDAHLPFTDVPAIEEYLAHDLCADLALYCRRGVRSGEVGAVLAEHGYRFVRVLEGGIEAWQAAGYPVE